MSRIDPATTAASMAEVLQAWADQTPDALAFCFLIDGEEEGPRLTYAELDRAARAVAAALHDVAGPGDRALLLYPPGLEFIAAFFGCLYAGIVPVPAYPPRPSRSVRGWQPLAAIAADCLPRVVLTGGPIAPAIVDGIGNVHALADARCIVTGDLDPSLAPRWPGPKVGGHDLALLQYTSGSTAAPRGVMLTHSNLMHNEAMIQAAFEHSGKWTGVIWLPFYHDMGLIGGVLQTIFCGAACVLMPPFAFLQRPARWLRAISRYRAVTSGGPDFAYEYCTRWVTPEEKIGLDLSHWRVAFSGAEPVRAETLDRFAVAFAQYGFRRESFYPCYGLAEASLFVTGGTKANNPVLLPVDTAALELGLAQPVPAKSPDARTLVGCGHPWADQDVRVVHPETRVSLPDGAVGEIWVSGASVGRGYWNRPDETEYAFRATLGDTGEGPYLRTGDLGFVRDGELFVTGRTKELIILRGRNYYPQDIEATVQSVHPDLRPGGGAAFEVDGPAGPRLVVVQEVERRCQQLDVAQVATDVRRAVIRRFDLSVDDFRLLEPGSLPKTTSGKSQRHLCRAGYLGGTLLFWGERGI